MIRHIYIYDGNGNHVIRKWNPNKNKTSLVDYIHMKIKEIRKKSTHPQWVSYKIAPIHPYTKPFRLSSR